MPSTSGLVSSLLLAASAAAQTSLLTSTREDRSSTIAATATGPNTAIASATGTGAPCAQVSSLLAAAPSTSVVLLDAGLANACEESAPIVQADALELIDAVSAVLEWQSTQAYLKSPPPGYLLAGVDLVGQMTTLRNNVSSGYFKTEIDFEGNLTQIITSAHDGHLSLQLDGISVFQYGFNVGDGLISVSSDGKALPEIYLADDIAANVNGTGPTPVAISQINGVNASTYLQMLGENITMGGFQDPDALYNSQVTQLNSIGGNPATGLFPLSTSYLGETTTLTFANGSKVEIPNFAITQNDFTGVVDGPSFYNAFCNATAKAEQAESSGSGTSLKKRNPTKVFRRQAASTTSTPAVTQIPGYPSPVAINSDGSVSGYFIEGNGFEDLAVIVMTQMSETDGLGFQSTMSEFLAECVKQNKKQLVIDVSGNPGGDTGIASDSFKQLFPDITPYGASNLRATDALNLLGSWYTTQSQDLRAQKDFNETEFDNFGGTTFIDAIQYDNDSLVQFSSWSEYYGPVQAYNDNFTNLIRENFSDPNYDEQSFSFVVSGYANMTDVPASPFTSENIVILSDGQCSSTCTIFTHLLKYQGKVKSFAIGGRPQTTAMQAIGGVKGSQVFQSGPLVELVQQAFQMGSHSDVKAFNGSSLGTLNSLGDYLALRTESAGASPTDFQFNLRDNIYENDTALTPAQFIYEAADCHLWFQPQHYLDIRTRWTLTAAQAFGLNGSTPYSLCVAGSTNQSSSLSGNATLFNNGVPDNVTTFIPEGQGSSGKGKKNSATQIGVSAVASLAFAAAVALAL